MKVLTLDIGGTFIKYAIMDETAQIYDKGKCPTPQTEREALLDTLTQIFDTYEDVEGIAISMPGIIDNKQGHCIMGGALRYNDDFYLRDALYKSCKTRIIMENDANLIGALQCFIRET